MANQNSIADLDTTPANNLNFRGQSMQGTAPVSTIDNMFQKQSAMLAALYDSIGGSQTAGGTATALTVTITDDWTAYANGLYLAIKAPSAATGAATLVVTVPTAGALASKKIRRQGDSAIQANDWLAGATILLKYDSAYDSSAGAWVLLNGAAGSSASATQILVPTNLGLAASVGSSALTVSLKGVDGNDPSASNPVVIPFRNVTAATGTPSYLTITAATSIVISSGSTMGFTSTVAGRLWVVGFNDAGTFRMGLVNCLSGTSIMALRNGIYSSTAEGGSGGADSAQVIYTGTAVSSKAMTILGYVEATEATAGTWATAPSTLEVWRPGLALPGDTIQAARLSTGASATGTTTVPFDNTIPQNTEGDQYMSQAITPISATNVLRVHAMFLGAGNTVSQLITASLFQDSTANALVSSWQYVPAANAEVTLPLNYEKLSATTSSTTFKVRAGTNAAATTTFNGAAGSQNYGGVLGSFLHVFEVMA